MAIDPSSSFFEAGWHISYMNYCATGEGVTSYIAVAGTAAHAERILKKRLPEFFHQLTVTVPIDAMANDDVKKMIQWIPDPAIAILRQLPSGAGHYFTELRYNLS
ncbi:MAG TPA: hypothetical protein PLN33_15090 [Hyphomonadaceae bacterium]|jgi:hypothetical protein|nr:hypothetical protein [Hyphomonadaceae bacterium]